MGAGNHERRTADLKARLLDLGVVDPRRSLAGFHAVARSGEAPPTLVLVQPERPFISIGYHQEAEREIDLAFCREAGLPVYRRQVGGGAVLLDRGQVFFHLLLPEKMAPLRVEERYRLYTEPALRTYREFGVPAEFRPVNDLVVGERKIGGTGGATLEGTAVFVGSIILEFDAETMARALRVPDEKMRDKVHRNLLTYVTSLRRELGRPVEPAAVKESLVRHFGEVLGLEFTPGTFTSAEERLLAEVEAELESPEWLHLVRLPERPWGVKISGEVYLRENLLKAPGGLLRVTARLREGRLEDVLLSGDFYAHPQEAWDGLSRALQGTPLAEDAIRAAVEGYWERAGLTVPGVSPDEVVRLLLGLRR